MGASPTPYTCNFHTNDVRGYTGDIIFLYKDDTDARRTPSSYKRGETTPINGLIHG